MYFISAMFAECEQIFSSTKLFISNKQVQMRNDIMEASECLKAWDKLKF